MGALLPIGDAKVISDRGGYDGYGRAADPNMADDYAATLETLAKEGINAGNAVIAAIAAKEEGETRSIIGAQDRSNTAISRCFKDVLRKCFRNIFQCTDVNKLSRKLLRCLAPETRSEPGSRCGPMDRCV